MLAVLEMAQIGRTIIAHAETVQGGMLRRAERIALLEQHTTWEYWNIVSVVDKMPVTLQTQSKFEFNPLMSL